MKNKKQAKVCEKIAKGKRKSELLPLSSQQFATSKIIKTLSLSLISSEKRLWSIMEFHLNMCDARDVWWMNYGGAYNFFFFPDRAPSTARKVFHLKCLERFMGMA